MNRKNLFIIDPIEDDSYILYFNSFAVMSKKDMRSAFQKAPKDLTITIFGNKYLVNKLIISDISVFVYNLIHNDENLKELSLDSYFKSTFTEEKTSSASAENLNLFGETLTKFFDVINGYSRKFDIRKEQKYLAKISRILCIVLPPHLVVNQRQEYDYQTFTGNIVEIELSTYSLYDFFTRSPKTFSLKFGDSEKKVNSIILTLSDVIYEEYQKNPDLKTYTFDLDDKKNELTPIIDFLSVKDIILTTNNIDIILNAAETMKIQAIIDLANSLKKKFEESQTIYDNEEDKINSLIDLQDLLFNLNEENFDESLSSLFKTGFVSTKEDIKEFISNLCNAVIYRPKTRKIYVKLISQLKQNELLETFNKDDFFINFLIKYIISLSRNSFLICPLIYELYENEKIIDKKTLTRMIFKNLGCIENNSNKKVLKEKRKFTPSYSLIWFLPEMEEEYPIIFDLITKWDTDCVFGQFFSIIKLNLDAYRQDNWKLFKEGRSLMSNPDPFAIVIANDDAEQLQIMCSKISFNFSAKIKMCLFENIEEISLIDYAAQHGSINCFKYMLLNGASIRNSTYNYAVIGGSIEIIHIIDNELGNNILNDIVNDADNIGDIWRQVTAFYIPYGSYQLKNVLMSVMLKIYHFHYTNYMQLETVLISCIIYHRDEVFEWLMNKHLTNGKVLALALCSIASIAYNNMKDFMLIVDSGLFIYSEFKNFDDLLKKIIKAAASNGFSEIISMTASLYGADLINNSALDKIYSNFFALRNYYGDILIMKGKSIFSEAAAFGSIKIVNNFKEQFCSLPSTDFIYAISKSIYNGNFDFAEFALNIQLFNQENENQNDNDNKNDNAKIVKRNAVFINKKTIEEWILNAIKSCDKNNIQFVEYLISNLDIYFEKCSNKQKIIDYLDKELISSALLTCIIYNDNKFFAWIVNHYINQVSANKIEECLLQASYYGYLTMIIYCLTTLSYLCTDTKKSLIIDVNNSQYINEKDIHINQKIAKKIMQNAAKYDHHEVILYLIEKIPGIFAQFINDAFKAALSQSHSLTCRSLLSNMSFQPTPELLILSLKSNLNEVVIKILEINHSSELLNSISEGETCLTVASSFSSIEIIQYLLDNFSSLIDPNIRNSNGDTALICAALHQRFDVIQILCDKFQNRLEMWQINALVPAFFSFSNSNKEQKKNEKIDMDDDFFVKFNPQENVHQVRNLASNGIDICYFLLNTYSTSSSSIQSPTPSSDIDKWEETDKFELDWNYLYNDMTPLMIAAKMNNLPLLQFLISIDDVDVNARNAKDGDTALLIAAYEDNELIVDALVNHKRTKIGIENKYGESVLIKSIIPNNTNNKFKFNFNQPESRSANVISKIISSPNFSSQISQEQLGEALICAITNFNIAIFNNLLRIPNINVMHTSKMYSYRSANDSQYNMIRNWRDDLVALAAFYSNEDDDYLAPIINHNSFNMFKCNLQKAAIFSTCKNMNTIYQPILNLLNGNVNVVDQESGISLLNSAILSCSSALVPLILTSHNFDKEKNDIDNAISWDFVLRISDSNIIINSKFGPAQNQEADFGQNRPLRNNENDENNNNDNDNQDKKDENNNNDNDNQDKKDENNNENDNDNQTKNVSDEDEINKNLCIKTYNNIMSPYPSSVYLETQTIEIEFGQGTVLKNSLFARSSFDDLVEYQDRIDPNKTDVFGNNNFTYASFISPIAVDNLLRMKGADLNQQNKLNGMTTLMYACILVPEMIQTLLENENIDISIKDFEGKTAFDHIVERYDLDIDEDFEQPSTREEFKDWIYQNQKYLISRSYQTIPYHRWNY